MLEAFASARVFFSGSLVRGGRRLTNSQSGGRRVQTRKLAAVSDAGQSAADGGKLELPVVPKARYRDGDRVILFDGVCNVCNFGVDAVLRLDDAKQFKFASLQGAEGAKLLEKYNAPKDLSTMVYIDGSKAYLRSDAILHIGKRLPLFSRLSRSLLFTVPKPIRDWLYTEVLANNRYRLFGKRDTCRLPSPEEQALFLD